MSTQRWPITAEDRRKCVESMMEIIRSDDTPCAIRAARLLIEMEGQNMKDDHGKPVDETSNRFADIIETIKRQSKN